MDESLMHMAKATITYSLLAVVLSGCAYFTATEDDATRCQVGDLPNNRQPFDFSARKHLQRLIDRDSDSNEGPAKSAAFVRLDEQGVPLTSQQAIYDSEPWAKDYSTVPWACVRDNRTGLTWEVKTNDLSLRDMHWTYTWYESPQAGKDGYTGKANGGKCPEGSTCDTQAYVAAINAEKLCGHDDWRLPHVFELHTLLNRTDNCPGTCIDPRYFPNTAKGGYWSSSSFEEFICYAWAVDFELGDASGAHKNTPLSIRLVRGKWLTSINNSENNGPP